MRKQIYFLRSNPFELFISQFYNCTVECILSSSEKHLKEPAKFEKKYSVCNNVYEFEEI